jgi:hypothetical protein
MRTGPSIPFALAILVAGCGSSAQPCAAGAAGCPSAATLVAMDFTAKGDFYAAPFPTDARTGGADVGDFPNAAGNTLVTSILGILQHDAGGFGLTSGIFFRLSAPLDPTSIPTVAASVAAGSSVVLLGIDPASPDYLHHYPVSAAFLADGGPYGTPNMLALLPLQGAPLRPRTRYAAVVMRALHDAAGQPLGVSPTMAAIAAGTRPAGLGDAGFASYQAAVAALGKASIDVTQVAGLAAFTTGAPDLAVGKVITAMNATPPVISSPWVPHEVFTGLPANYCVYETTIPMPEYQEGAPPYTSSGGDWVFDAAGNPVLQRQEEASFVVTIPATPMPAAGYPIVVLSRTGAGGNRPLVDRGAAAVNGGPAIIPGSGPALYYAMAGYAGSSIDGPLGGLRNPTNGNEDFLIFNVGNPAAMRDNVRQSAAELALQAHILEHVSIDVSGCPGAVAPGNMATFDVGNMALMGHSMGATISPLALAYEPRFRAGLFSGEGGSWIENVLYKQLPVPLLGIAGVLIGVAGSGYDLTAHDPLLSMFQWSCESADPPVYGRRITVEPQGGPARHVLMMQGIVDHYIMPPIADSSSLSFSLDLAGAELDDTPPEIAGLAPVGPLLPLVGGSTIALPASANVTSAGGVKITAVVTQHPSDGIEDGHEVVFQTDPPKHEYVCFLQGLLKGMPAVPAPGKPGDPCQ